MAIDRPNRNAILILGPDEIKGLINMEEAVAAIAQGYKEADEFPIGNETVQVRLTQSDIPSNCRINFYSL